MAFSSHALSLSTRPSSWPCLKASNHAVRRPGSTQPSVPRAAHWSPGVMARSPTFRRTAPVCASTPWGLCMNGFPLNVSDDHQSHHHQLRLSVSPPSRSRALRKHTGAPVMKALAAGGGGDGGGRDGGSGSGGNDNSGDGSRGGGGGGWGAVAVVAMLGLLPVGNRNVPHHADAT